MFNIHEMATMWPMQTLGSFGLLNWKTCDEEEMYFYAPIATVISIEIMLSLLIFNKMIKKKQFKNKDKIKTHKHSKD